MKIEMINGNPTRMLDEWVKTNGTKYKKIEEGDNYYVYSEGGGLGETGNFEIILKVYKKKSDFDKHTEYTHIEHYPATSEWGKYAWSYTRYENVKRFIRKKFFGETFYNDEDFSRMMNA